MRLRLTHAVLMAVALSCAHPTSVYAQDGDGGPGAPEAGERPSSPGDEEANGPEDGANTSGEDGSTSPETPDFPDDPNARLERAVRAYSNGKYQLLRPLLEPTLVPKSQFDDMDREIKARQLFGVGLFFKAQQTTKPAERRDLLDRTKRQFLAILRQAPDYELDPLNYPASVVEVFETVREDNAEELDEIRAKRSGEDSQTASETFYVERVSTKRWFAVNFAPFGLGQFQNGNPIAGRLFAVGQGSMLALNAVGYLGVQLADENGDGLYLREGRGGEFAVAKNWQTVQWFALGGFAALYVWSVIDGIARYEPEEVRIRSLDEPPPELSLSPKKKRGPAVHIGIGSVLLRW